jgi:Flp pilus assembly protein TadD
MRSMLVAVAVAYATSVVAAQESQHEMALKHLAAGREAVRAEHWQDAEREFTTALQLDPLLDLAHYGLGQVYMSTRRYDDAVKAYTRSRDVYHENEVARLANNGDAERRLDDQIRELRDERRNLESGRFRTMNPIATANRLDAEITQLEAMRNRRNISVDAVPPYISTALGSAYFRLSAFSDAEREWHQALAVDPKIGEVHNNLAVLYMVTERYDDADRELALAEKTGFKVSSALKQELKAKMTPK